MHKLFVTRFRKEYPIEVVAMYRKGKRTKLNLETIRPLIRSNKASKITYLSGTHHLMMVEPPSKDSFFTSMPRDAICGVTGVYMHERPDAIGNLGCLKGYDIDENDLPETLSQRNRNYYLVSEEEANQALELMAANVPCFRIEKDDHE